MVTLYIPPRANQGGGAKTVSGGGPGPPGPTLATALLVAHKSILVGYGTYLPSVPQVNEIQNASWLKLIIFTK